VLVDDAQADERFDAAVDQAGGVETRNCVCLAVPDPNDKPMAILQVINKKVGNFDQDDEHFLGVFAKQAGVMMRNALLFKETTVSKTKKAQMTKSLLSLCAELRVGPLLKLFCQHGAQLLGGAETQTTCVVYLLDTKTEGMLLKYNHHGFECKIKKTGLASRVLTTGEIVNVVAGQDTEPAEEEKGGAMASNILCGPVFDINRELMGAVHISNADDLRPFTPNDEELMKELCDVASVALNNAQLVNPESLGATDAKEKKDEK
jgi:adenylate cyclase